MEERRKEERRKGKEKAMEEESNRLFRMGGNSWCYSSGV